MDAVRGEGLNADGIHNQINTRAELERYDPELARLIAEAFANNTWRWRAPPRIGPIWRR